MWLQNRVKCYQLLLCEKWAPHVNAPSSLHSVAGFALPLRTDKTSMKKTHIILLILVISGIVGMSFFIKDLTTYETFSSAAGKKDQFLGFKPKLEKEKPIG